MNYEATSTHALSYARQRIVMVIIGTRPRLFFSFPCLFLFVTFAYATGDSIPCNSPQTDPKKLPTCMVLKESPLSKSKNLGNPTTPCFPRLSSRTPHGPNKRDPGGGVTSRSIHILSVLRLVYSTVAKNRAISSISGSPLQKSHPTMILVWLQQMILRASNCSL